MHNTIKAPLFTRKVFVQPLPLKKDSQVKDGTQSPIISSDELDNTLPIVTTSNPVERYFSYSLFSKLLLKFFFGVFSHFLTLLISSIFVTSLIVLEILLSWKANPDQLWGKMTLIEKIMFSLPPGFALPFVYWCFFNDITKRLFGKDRKNVLNDLDLERGDQSSLLPRENDRLHVFILLVGLFFISYALPILQALALAQQFKLNSSLFLGIGGVLSTGVYILVLHTQAITIFRKHVESCEDRGQLIYPLYQQVFLKSFYEWTQKWLISGNFYFLFPLKSLLQSFICMKFLQQWLLEKAQCSAPLAMLIGCLVGLFCYPNLLKITSYFNRALLRQSLIDAKENVSEISSIFQPKTRSTCSSKLYFVVSGDFFLECQKNIGIPLKYRQYGLFLFNIVGVFMILDFSLTNFVISDNPENIRDRSNAILLNYFFGENQAIVYGERFYNTIVPAVSLACTFFINRGLWGTVGDEMMREELSPRP